MPTSPGQKREWERERDLLIYTRLQEDLLCSLKNSLNFDLNPKNEPIPLFIGRRRNSQLAPGRVQNLLWPDRAPSKRSTGRSTVQSFSIYWKYQLIAQSTESKTQLFQELDWSIGRSTDKWGFSSLCMSIDRPVDWGSNIEFKNSIFLCFISSLSLHYAW